MNEHRKPMCALTLDQDTHNCKQCAVKLWNGMEPMHTVREQPKNEM